MILALAILGVLALAALLAYGLCRAAADAPAVVQPRPSCRACGNPLTDREMLLGLFCDTCADDPDSFDRPSEGREDE